MAATKYTRSISTDFSNGVGSDRFQQEIEDDATIEKTLLRIDTNEDDCDAWFDDALTTAEETAYDVLVAAHSGYHFRDLVSIITDPVVEAVLPGASNVVANDRPAIEIQNGQDGWGAISAWWPYASLSTAELVVTVKFILESTGTGTVVRIGSRAKAEGVGDDSSEAWADTQYEDVTVSHTTLGEVFGATLTLDASSFDQDDAVALQVGRIGSHVNDTVSQPVQIIGVQARAQ